MKKNRREKKPRTKGTPVAAAWSGGRGESNTTRAVFLGFHRETLPRKPRQAEVV
jgi:hypothetical protein